MKKQLTMGILAHVDAGKTTLSEAMLYLSGAIRKCGRVDKKDTFLDTDAQERARGITIFSKQARFSWKNLGITLLDTPGHVDFSAEMERTLQVLDYAILLVSGADGVQGHTETLWKLLKRNNIPTFLFVNKMDQPGIDKEELSLVFIRYFQGRNGKHKEGSGIGLYLVKKYIELHGGHISIESNGGTVVRLIIPLTGDNSCVVNDTDAERDLSCGDSSARLLIIDDNKEIVAFLAETLSQHYECHKAYNGREGLDIIEQYTPDLIIVDQMMPEMDGFTFSRAVRKNYKTATTPVIMLTAKDDMSTELESIKVGVDIFMPKPFDIKKLQLQRKSMLKFKKI